jgi:hypothetical protein
MLSCHGAAEFLGTGREQIEDLITAGRLHAVRGAGDALWICKDSLIS